MTEELENIQVSLMVAGSLEASRAEQSRLVLEAGRFADDRGFSSVWVTGGGLPAASACSDVALLSAALARETKRIGVRAVVALPVHDALRVAEQWTLVDQLSGGRVGVAFASLPEEWLGREDELFASMDEVRRHWRRTLPAWITPSPTPQSYARAGAIGAHLLVRFTDHAAASLPERVALYRAARGENGYDPKTGGVTVWQASFLENGLDAARATASDLQKIGVSEIAYLVDLAAPNDVVQRQFERLAELGVLRRSDPGDTLQAIRSRCQRNLPREDLRERLRRHGVELGATSSGQDVWLGEGEWLARVQVDEAPVAPAATSGIPPGLLEACLQLLLAAVSDTAIHRPLPLLPTAAGLLRVHGDVSGEVWCHGVVRRTRLGGVEGDITLLGGGGEMLVEIGEVRVEQVRAEGAHSGAELSVDGDGIGEWLYEMRWEEQSLRAGAPPGGDWVILEDAGGVGEALAARLGALGSRCRRVLYEPDVRKAAAGDVEVWDWRAGEELEARVRAACLTCRGVVHLWGLDADEWGEGTSESVERAQGLGVESALWVMKALAGGGSSAGRRLWVVTRGAQAVGGEGGLSMAQTPLWGLGRTCAMEHPELWGALIDLDPAAGADTAADGVAAELRAAGIGAAGATGAEDQVCLRAGRRYVARLARRHTVGDPTEVPIRAEASYLITGGATGLGYEVARWLVRRGARHLVLLGRTPLPQRPDWDALIRAHPDADGEAGAEGTGVLQRVRNLTTLKALGAAVDYWALDVSDPAALRLRLGQYTGPEIRGVVHAASVWRDAEGRSLVRPLVRLEAAALRAVLRPKILGSWALHEALGSGALDFFVGFSSGASLLGSAGQGNYAAAGSFLDALAHHRRQRGLPGLSINWGPVAERGFGATEEGQQLMDYWEARGVGRLRVPEMLRALDWALGQERAQVGVMRLDWAQLRRSYPELSRRPWTSAFAAAVPESRPEEPGAFTHLLAAAPAAERRELLENHVREQVALIMGLESSDALDVQRGLFDMGVDSLMALELKTRLQANLQCTLPATIAFEQPSIRAIAAYLHRELSGIESAVAAPSEPAVRDGPNSIVDRIARLTDDEVDRRLSGKAT